MVRIISVLIMVFLLAGSLSAEETKTGKISGKLLTKGGAPLAGGLAFLFNETSGPAPSPNKYWRVPDEIVEIDNNGIFTAELVEGKYFLGAIKRPASKEVGPPQEGDQFFISQDSKGKPRSYQVRKGITTDLGSIAEAMPFKKSTLKEGLTAIEGTITDLEGKPVTGVFVFAFLTPAMVGKPMFVSEKTGKDGKYLLRVHEGGNYYLKIRELYGGGPPRQGGIIGGYGEEAPMAAAVKTGTLLRGIDIKGVRFPGQGIKPQ